MRDTLLRPDAGELVTGDHRTFVGRRGRRERVSGLLLAALGWQEGQPLRASHLGEAFPTFGLVPPSRPAPTTYTQSAFYVDGRPIAEITLLTVQPAEGR